MYVRVHVLGGGTYLTVTSNSAWCVMVTVRPETVANSGPPSLFYCLYVSSQGHLYQALNLRIST